MNTWRARSIKILVELQPTIDMTNLKEARKAIRNAYPFGERAMWPYKEWTKVVRELFPGLYPSRKPSPVGEPDMLGEGK